MVDFWIAVAAFGVVASAGLPLWHSLGAVRGTTLGPTIAWLIGSWLAWLAVVFALLTSWTIWPLLHIAVALVACAGISVLGARRPGLGAWNFVTLGLLAVLLLPLLEQPWGAPHWSLDLPRGIFTGLVLAVGVVNYVPTRCGLFVLIGGVYLEYTLWLLADPLLRAWTMPLVIPGVAVMLGCLVWLVWLTSFTVQARRQKMSAVDRLWLNFRDRYGLVWAKRVQEQFNQAAGHAGYEERLSWGGLAASELAGEREAQLLELLRAVLKRFGVEQGPNT